MFGEQAADLLRDYERSADLLPKVNEKLIGSVINECNMLYQENLPLVNIVANSSGSNNRSSGLSSEFQGSAMDVLPLFEWRHYLLERNVRCIVAYLYNRLERLKEMRWQIGSILPPDIRSNMTPHDSQWFSKYNQLLAQYMRDIGEHGGMDITDNLKPPKSLYIEVRCVVDHGEFETEAGSVILLKANSQHLLLRSECEHLIRQGVLVHILD